LKKNKITIVSLTILLGSFLFGFNGSVISEVIGFVAKQYELNELQQGWVVSSPSFAAMFAILVSGVVSDYKGRKYVLRIAAFLYVVSAVLSALVNSYEILVVARIIGGLVFGAALILVILHIWEVTPTALSGRMVFIQQFSIVLGFSISCCSNYLFVQQSPRWLLFKVHTERAKQIVLNLFEEKKGKQAGFDWFNYQVIHPMV